MRRWIRSLYVLVSAMLISTTAAAKDMAPLASPSIRVGNDVVTIAPVTSVEELTSLLPEGTSIDILEQDDFTISLTLTNDGDELEGMFDRETNTLTLFTDPVEEGCSKSYTGLSMCIAHTWWFQYCWWGSWYCPALGCGWDALGSCI